jgi:exopolyphosphatase/guanosine-5'-triphosphate,3'-diphosphate pyrophosphatase
LGAASIALAGTDPLRHAADAARACVEIERESGVPVHVLDQDEEGSLTLLGATGGSVHGDVAVIDIGGGSTEIVVAEADGSRRVVGLPIGASRLSAAVGVDAPTGARPPRSSAGPPDRRPRPILFSAR